MGVVPRPFKCSECEYIAVSRRDLDIHWSEEH